MQERKKKSRKEQHSSEWKKKVKYLENCLGQFLLDLISETFLYIVRQNEITEKNQCDELGRSSVKM